MLNIISFPPTNFGRYASQTELCMTESNGINEWAQAPPPPPPSTTITTTATNTTINDIPSLISVQTTTSPSIISTNNAQKMPIPTTIITDDIEPLPFPQHGPGPIQRPNKLTNPPTQQLSSPYMTTSIQAPETPDVLDHLNRLLDHQNHPITPIPSTTNVNNSSMSMHDLSTSNIPWTPFAPSEWSSKYESSWPLTNIQNSSVPLITTQVQNPFALMSVLNEQRQIPREESTVWSSVLGTATPRLISSSTRTQRASTWNDLFQNTVPSSNESSKPINPSWFKYWSAPDPSSVDGTLPNGHETETNNPFWSLSTLSNEPVVGPSAISNSQQVSSNSWWPNSNSDENNNKSQISHLNDDITNNRDQSRWDFAR
jgi:hypothetical protein